MRDDILAPSADPRGLYAALGVGPLADEAEIKRAYRRKAKILHPDFNPSDDAVQQFLRVVEAWRVLRDPKARRRYDEAAARQPLAPPLVRPDDPHPEPVACFCCGRVTAQPRYLVFHRVRSRLIRSHRSLIRGIFCRDCADRTAIRASTASWIGGWWGLAGPLLTLRALLVNLSGGERPRLTNLWLLLHQAQAFLARGEAVLARALADQAAAFAASDEERAHVARLAAAAGDPPRRLRDRWRRRRGHAAFVQSLPLAALGLAVAALLAGRVAGVETDRAGAEIAFRPAQAGETRHVAVDVLKVRQGPAASEPVLALLDRFATVEVMDSVGDGEWARILTAGGLTGYVPARFLFGGAGSGPKSHWCTTQRGEPPANGEVLMRRTGGQYRLRIDNAAGQDVVVRLKTPNGRTILTFFVAAGAETVISGIPDGTFRAVFATGQDYSRACGVFLQQMRAFLVPTAQIFHAASRRDEPAADLALTIPPIGEGLGQARPLPLESYLDN